MLRSHEPLFETLIGSIVMMYLLAILLMQQTKSSYCKSQPWISLRVIKNETTYQIQIDQMYTSPRMYLSITMYAYIILKNNPSMISFSYILNFV